MGDKQGKRDDLLAAARVQDHRDTAKRVGISEDELWRLKARMKIAWDASGGFEGAKFRLKFAQDYLVKEKVANTLDAMPEGG